MYEILQIKQMKDFICTGNDCIDTCCHSWAITINKATYKKYKKNNMVNLDNFTIIDKHDSNNYAKINLKNNGDCPFLCKDGLCEIHKNHGHKNLSDVCKIYPQKRVKYNDFIERSISLSCPAALDLLFATDDILEFDLDENPNKVTYVNGNKDGDITPGLSNKACFILRSLAITIVQNREVSLRDRLYMLGRVCDIIKNLIDNEYESGEITAYLLELEKTFKEEELLKYKDNSTLPRESRFEIIHKLLPIIKDMMQDGYSKNKEGFKEHIDKSIDNLFNISIEDTKKCKTEVIDTYFKENEYILENYIVHKLFSDIFPKDTGKVDVSYNLLLSKLLVLQMFMITLYKENKEINIKDVKNSIYFFERQIDHSKLKKALINKLSNTLNFEWEHILELLF